MVARRTIDLLPQVFQTNTNKRFLNATIDQMVQEPLMTRMSSYVGRAEGSPTYRAGDPYVVEGDSFAQAYQLEPSLAVRNRVEGVQREYNVDNVYNYLDMLNKIGADGGINNDSDRLFKQEYYNYQGFVDLEKLINYGQYYWVPNGPASLDVNSGGIEIEKNFFVSVKGKDTSQPGYVEQVVGAFGHTVSGYSNDINPTITLVRGGTYQFTVNQIGTPFYIQTEAGDLSDTSNYLTWQGNINKREVMGVVNNGTDSGVITFNVPKKTDQDEFINMQELTPVDFVIDAPFNEINGVTLDQANTKYQLDGVQTGATLKRVVFTDVTDDGWVIAGHDTPTKVQRKGFWQMKIDPATKIISCTYLNDWPINTKVTVKNGRKYGNRQVYKDSTLTVRFVPPITANLTTLYYQSPDYGFGEIKIVEPAASAVLNVNDMLGKANYTSPNGVRLTNGLKIRFTQLVEPVEYKDNEYIVEGVGTAITLQKWNNLSTPESYTKVSGSGYDASGENFDITNFDSTLNAPIDKDYITINRASTDGNPWSRGNRWFHKEVLSYSASILTPGVGYVFNEINRAKRPIIEFLPNLKLFQGAKDYAGPVSLVDTTTFDALSEIEGAAAAYVDGVALSSGTTVIFMQDSNLEVRKTIYQIQLINVIGLENNNVFQVHLVPVKRVSDGESVVVTTGIKHQGIWYYYDDASSSWLIGQPKLGINTEPLFDIWKDGVSLADSAAYPGTTYAGSKLFSYRKNASGTADSELDFALSYRSIGNIGDILFDNNFDTDTFGYSVDNVNYTPLVNIGNPVRKMGSSYVPMNPWAKIEDKSKQYVVKDFTASLNKKNDFVIPVAFATSRTEQSIFVWVNGVKNTDYQLFLDSANGYTLMHFSTDLAVGDAVHLKIYGKSSETKSIYTVPKNLERNSFNDTFDSVTLGQMRDHLIEITANSLDFSGDPTGNNNLRDIDYLKSSGTILQHSAPFHLAQLFFNNPGTDIIRAIDYNRKEYARFKEKFLELLETLSFKDINDSRAVVDRIMADITDGVDPSSPFYYTDMVASGNNYLSTQYVVFNPADRSYTTVRTYDYADPSEFYKNILVYHNGVQLVNKRDYTVSGRIVTLLDSLTIAQDDLINIYEYESSLGCSVPATPSKMGIFPSYVPEIYEDTTIIDVNVSSKNVIQGHDGSITIAFNDYRDGALLEFEKRVYNNIRLDWLTDNTLAYHQTVEPNAFRVTDYSFDEWTQLLSIGFLEWAGRNGVDIFQNTITSNDEFSYNYAAATDKLFNDLMPGYWRGIYKYFYETDRPHTHPWEIAGYPVKPVWWERKYGPGPYSSGNLVMWQDLEDGIYWTDPSGLGRWDVSAVDPLYVKPGLTSIIPVDEHGILLPPRQSVVKQYNSLTASAQWRFGDHGPTETAWRRSSDYPFSVMMAYAMARPAEFCAYTFNLHDYQRDAALDQVLNTTNNNRKIYSTISGDAGQYPGTNIWLRDRLASLGLDVDANLTYMIEDVTLNLAYKMSGFTDKRYLQIIAEQSSPNSKNTGVLVPDENYQVILTKSAPTSRDTYTAVVVQKTDTGYSISGFDTYRPYFTIIPSLVNDNNFTVTIGNSSAVIYGDGDDKVLVVPYGTNFANKQQLADFLISYGRYLRAKGFIFEDILQDQVTIQDWTLAVKEFLWFTQQGWDAETIISLTPAGSAIKFDNGVATADDISDTYNGSRIMNSDGSIVTRREYRVYRDGTSFEIQLNDTTKGIHLLDIQTVQLEHTLLFDNTTVFNDVIYQPNIGNRQQRLKIVGRKSSAWNGSLYAPGFLINHRKVDEWTSYHDYYKGDMVTHKNRYYTASKFLPGAARFDQNDWYEIKNTLLGYKLIPNPAFNAKQFEDFYDVDKEDVNVSADIQSRHATGFQPRRYFTDISLSPVSQHKFYLGMIAEKGTKAVIDKFLRAQLPYLENQIDVYEEWAIKEGSYGNTDNGGILELPLSNVKTVNNTAVIELLDKNDVRDTRWNTFKTQDFDYIPSGYTKNIFAETSNSKKKIPTTGPVLLSEVAATVFNVNKIENIGPLAPLLGEGSLIWVGSDIDDDWRVYRASTDYGLYVNTVSKPSNLELEFTTGRAHGLSVRDKVLIKTGIIVMQTAAGGTTSGDISGVYRVTKVGDKMFRVSISDPNLAIQAGPIRAMFYRLESVRYDSRKSFAQHTPHRGWKVNDKVYIDNVNGGWQVLENTLSWQYQETHSPMTVSTDNDFGQSMALSTDQRFMYIASTEDYGKVYVYARDDFDQWNEIQSIEPTDAGSSYFGAAMQINDLNRIFVSDPDNNNRGAVYVLKNVSANVTFDQVIYDPTANTGDGVGTTISASKDGNWLYIGVPGQESVYAYKLTKVVDDSKVYTGNGSNQTFIMPLAARVIAAIPDQIKVFVDSRILVPYLDYGMNIDNTAVVLTNAPANGSTVTVEYSDYYEYVDYIFNPLSADGSSLSLNDFPSSISTSTDGSQVVIGASAQKQQINNIVYTAGAVCVIDRTIEKFIGDGSTLEFDTAFLINTPRVTVDDIEIDPSEYNFTDYTVTFLTAPDISSIVSIETNNFRLSTTILPPTVQEGMKFGYQTLICPNNCSIYTSAPRFYNLTGDPGTVYRNLNLPKVYGTLTGKVANPTVTIGDALRINGFLVEFTGTTLQSVVDDINSVGIPGVMASITSDNKLYVETDSQLTFNKLTISNDNGNAFANLGIELFTNVQKIESIFQEDGLSFGETLSISPDATKLVISTTKGSSYGFSTYDEDSTSFDGGSMLFKDKLVRSGAAYLYEYQASATETSDDIGKFTYAMRFLADNVKAYDAFGRNTVIGNNWLMIGSPHGSWNGVSKGVFYVFRNPDNSPVWKTIRSQTAGLDSNKLKRAFIYNNKLKEVVAELPVIDGINGKVMPSVSEKIDYAVNYDPATYNYVPRTTGFSFDLRNVWGKEHVGKLWWDTNALKYLDWQQGNLLDRSLFKEQLFPSSTINVYEWVESDLPPLQYNAEMASKGMQTLYVNNEVYSQISVNDPYTNAASTKYYFWAQPLSSAAGNNKIANLRPILQDPRNSNLPFVSVIDTNAIALANCQDLLGNDYVLRLEFNRMDEILPVHNQWSIYKDGSRLGLSDSVYSKLIDSLAAQDALGREVPDPKLKDKQKYGLDIRPRQSVFADYQAAKRFFWIFANDFFSTYPLRIIRNIQDFLDSDPYPDTSEYDEAVSSEVELAYLDENRYLNKIVLIKSDGTIDGGWTLRRLETIVTNSQSGQQTNQWTVIKAQTYDVKQYWDYADWYASGYSSSTIPTYHVDFVNDINNLDLKNNDTIKIMNASSGGFQLVKVADGSLELVGQQSATIQLRPSFYDPSIAGEGPDGRSLDAVGFAKDNNIETRKIFDALVQILTNSSGVFVEEFRKIGRSLFDQGLTLIGSQFRETDFLIRTSFISIDHKIRRLSQIPVYVKQPESLVEDYIKEVKPYHAKIRKYTSSYPGSDTAGMFSTDFDLPPYLSPQNTYRSPQMENPYDIGQFDSYPAQAWLENYGYEIDTIDIVDGGVNYTNDTVITIKPVTSANGVTRGGGATARVKVKAGGIINQIILETRGDGFMDNPDVIIEGTGTGAVLKARLRNNKVRTLKTTLVFDRYTYNNQIPDWQPNTDYFVDDLFVYDYRPYRVTEDFTSGAHIDLTYALEYKLYRWQPNTRYSANDIVVTDWAYGIAYLVVLDHVSPYQINDDYLANTKLIVPFYGNLLDAAADRIWSYYKPARGQPGRQLPQLMKGIEYPGVNVQALGFDQAPGFDDVRYGSGLFDSEQTSAEGVSGLLDSVYYGYFTDANLGLRPEDIITDGAGFVDTYNSNAPEEFVPGRVFDALDIKVTTTPGNNQTGGAAAPDITVVGTYVDNNTSFPFSNKVYGGVEKLIVWSHKQGFKTQGTDFTVDWINLNITFTNLNTSVDDVIYIMSIGATGENILEETSYIADGSTAVFALPNQKVSQAKQVYVKVDGVQATNYHLGWDEVNIPAWQPNTTYYNGDLVSYNGKVYQAKQDFTSLSFFNPNLLVIGLDPGTIPTWQDNTRYPQGQVIAYDGLMYQAIDTYTSGDSFDNSPLAAYDYYACIVFDTPPADNAFIQIRGFNETATRKAYSSVKEINYTVSGTVTYPSSYTFTIPEEMQYNQPWATNLTVRVNNVELCPPNNTYYTADGSTNHYYIPMVAATTPATLSNSDVVVIVNNVLKNINIDYTVFNDGSSNPAVIFNSTPAAGAEIVISDHSVADYRVSGATTVVVKPNLTILQGGAINLKAGDKVTLIAYSNHDTYDMRTQVFAGVRSTSSAIGGVDAGGFDAIGFDADSLTVVSNPTYELTRPTYNLDFLQVFVNGIPASVVYDYRVENNTKLIMSPDYSLKATDVIHVRQFSEELRNNTIKFRLFKDMNDNHQFLGIAADGVARLTSDLNFDDTIIYLDDTSGLSSPGITANQPGVIFIDGERITYWVKDDDTNTLSQIRRSTGGTGGKIHAKGTLVEDGSIGAEILGTSAIRVDPTMTMSGDKVWYSVVNGGQISKDGSTRVVKTDGKALQYTNTVQANYLKSISR